MPAEKIDHSVYVCRDTDKTRVIRHIFDENPPERVIVFASSKLKVKELAAVLAKTYDGVAAMHSDLDQKDRFFADLGGGGDRQRDFESAFAEALDRGLQLDSDFGGFALDEDFRRIGNLQREVLDVEFFDGKRRDFGFLLAQISVFGRPI